ncbi:MAG TPA: hypothetical protein VLE95_02865, partial [Chlamydiales bacterium]|nr:hypothetical protein [Chlamydiales bacterium]
MNATDKVILTFGWNGPTSWKGVQMEKVDFLLPELQAKVNVSIPKRLSRGRALPFNSQKGDRQTTPEFLRVLANRLQNLTLQLIMKDGPRKLKEEWTLAPLPPLEAEQMYQLTVHASDELQFALSLDPVEQKDLIAKEKQQFCEIL